MGRLAKLDRGEAWQAVVVSAPDCRMVRSLGRHRPGGGGREGEGDSIQSNNDDDKRIWKAPPKKLVTPLKFHNNKIPYTYIKNKKIAGKNEERIEIFRDW